MGEFEGGDEAGLLVQAAEVTDKVDDGILFLEGFIGQGVIEVVDLYLAQNMGGQENRRTAFIFFF